ncbi:MAG TPA: hypothetical protein DET40_17425 [Lentisphaeria bacterium]|nr:MAG: hypothetical protein A2X45_02580 [Lentisphaerae bacterium GWF2_50_93]HCE45323.1 hypothetical protein [Lentisphaeria bacterium]
MNEHPTFNVEHSTSKLPSMAVSAKLAYWLRRGKQIRKATNLNQDLAQIRQAHCWLERAEAKKALSLFFGKYIPFSESSHRMTDGWIIG